MHAHKSNGLQVFFHIKGNKLGHRIATEKLIYNFKTLFTCIDSRQNAYEGFTGPQCIDQQYL